MVERNLRDRYRLEHRIGQGGMATVYAGLDTVLRRRVAIKVLRPQFAEDEEFVKRFYSEAQHAAKLSHPNIVNIYDVGREGDAYYIVMELVDGATLGEMIESDGRLPEAVTIDFAAQICNGLAYAHRQGLLHRDIKPANILVTKDDVVKLSDFGIARAVTTQTVTMTAPGMVVGSVFYVSPEQAQGFDLHEPSDLYGVGVVLFQMLTGKLPYTGESPVTVALKHVSAPIPALDVDGAPIGAALTAIVRKLLQKDPAARFSSAVELAAALREARERPSFATPFDTAEPASNERTMPRPKPRPSRHPDRDGASAGSRPAAAATSAARRRAWMRTPLLAVLGVVLLLAVLGGYWFASRPGAPFGAPSTIALDSFVGHRADDAERAVAAAGLTYAVVPVASETVAAGRVVRQDPGANAKLAARATVTLYVSSGLPTLRLDDVRQFSQDDATRVLRNARLNVKVSGRYDKAPRGQVLTQSPAPGARVPIRAVVSLVVSQGPQPVDVPAVVTMTLDDATRALAARGLSVQVGQRVSSDAIAPNVVTSQDPQAGTAVEPGSAVVVVVSDGTPQSPVPDVGGRSLAEATDALRRAGLAVRVAYIEDATAPNGTVMGQQPAGGAGVHKGQTITLQVSVSGVVPDLRGKGLDEARAMLQNAGYSVGSITPVPEGQPGLVVRANPGVGEPLRPGNSVDLQVGAAPAPAAPSPPESAASPAAAP